MRVFDLFEKIIASFSIIALTVLLAHHMTVPVGTEAKEVSSNDRAFLITSSEADELPKTNETPDVLVTYETELEEIAFETVYISDPTLTYQTQKVVNEGVCGEKSYTYEVISSNGTVVSRTLVEEKITKSVENRVIHVGDDPTTPYGEMIVPTLGKLTSRYGYRPNVGASNYHYGIDIAWKKGTPVVAADGGVVTEVKRISSFGLYIVIDHGSELETLYAHLDSVTVNEGDRVARGQLVGYMGETGNATGPCLHFEVILRGNRINPLKGYIQASDIIAPDN